MADDNDGAIRALFYPKSAAVIGASSATGKLGHMVLANLVQWGFRGPIYPVNPSETSILGLKAYSSLDAIPESVELAVLAVPGRAVVEVMEQAAARGVRAAVIVSAGFSETDSAEGKAAETRIRQLANDAGMAVIGPNCQGVLSSRGRVSAWFGPLPERHGKALFVSQSGGLAGTLIDWVNHRQVPLFDSVVSLGNKCTIDEADLLTAFADDPAIQVAMCYIEGFGRGRGKAFMEAARAFSRKKTVVVLKGGRSTSGGRATSSHTGSLAGHDRVFAGAMDQAGVHLTNSIREFINVARQATTCGVPTGRRVLILTNLGGPGVITADLCEKQGLTVVPTPAPLRESLHRRIPAYCPIGNPIDLTGDPDPKRYGAVLDLVYRSEAFDSILIVGGPMSGSLEVAADIVRAQRKHFKPTAVCWMTEESREAVRPILEKHGIPVYEMPEDAVRALAAIAPAERSPRECPKKN